MPASAGEADMAPVDNHQDEMTSLSSLIQHKMVERPKLLRPSAGGKECCIFRVHQELIKINEEAYYPRLVSIGPYHHGEEHLQMLEEHKGRFLKSLLVQSGSLVILQGLIDAISPLEERIRESYSECIDNFSRSELVMMMILDGCFIIEFFLLMQGLVQCEPDCPIVNIPCMPGNIVLDLFKLENQIPYFILENLFEKTWASREGNTTFACLAKCFLYHDMQGPSHIVDDCINHINNQTAPTKHLLDLYWTILVMPISDTNSSTSVMPTPDTNPFTLVMSIPDTNPSTRNYDLDGLASRNTDRPPPDLPIVNHSTQMLRQAGIKFQGKELTKSFLEITFENGIIKIPLLKIDDDTCILLVNFIAFEQYYRHHPQVITSYASFMDDLIDGSVDSEYLQSKQIIQNQIGSHEEVGRFFNQICRNVSIDIDKFYRPVFEGINERTSNKCRVGWCGIKHKYFGAPWAWIAALGALLGLLLTATQTVFSVLGYVNPPK